jgi:hypothetical protein
MASSNAVSPSLVDPERLHRIVQSALPGAELVRVVPLKPDVKSGDESEKGAGYGAPLRLDVVAAGRARSLVLHTATANAFGHDRRADRAESVLLAADSYGSIPGHVAVLDVGAYRGADDFVSLAGTGEFYLLTAHAEGHVYAEDLRRIAASGSLCAADTSRQRTLARYLVGLHAEKPAEPGASYARCVRDTLGSGEGVFGIVDGYPDDVPGASRDRLSRIEQLCLAQRFRLRGEGARLRRTHGDFHPFNVLFDARDELSLLDASRGCAGDPADDVTCMAINYAFFGLGHAGAWRGALSQLWHGFWSQYREGSGDSRLCEVAPLFLAWRGLVLANPVWYPELRVGDRERILGFIEQALTAPQFRPESADEFFDA